MIESSGERGCMYVRVCSMFTSRLSVTVSMERNSINWAKGRGLSKGSYYFPNCTRKTGLQHIIDCHAANFARRALRSDWESFQTVLQLVLSWVESATPNSQVRQITKFSPRRIHCKQWVCFFGWELEGNGEDAGTTIYSQHRFTNFQFVLQS